MDPRPRRPAPGRLPFRLRRVEPRGGGTGRAGDPDDASGAARPRSPRLHPPRRLPLPVLVLVDLLLVGVGLMAFSLFHHVLPQRFDSDGLVLPTPTALAGPTEAPGGSPTGSPTAAATGVVSPDPSATPAATPTPDPALSGDWGVRFAEYFTDGAVVQTGTEYRSRNLSIQVETHQEDGVTWYVADIRVRSLEYLRSAFAGGEYARNVTDPVPEIAGEAGAILAMTGDYYGGRSLGLVIRNGILYRETLFEDVLVMYHDGRMETMTAAECDVERLKREGAWQAWSFGPMLLQDGEPMTRFNSTVPRANPRSAIGYYEPGHYCFVLVDGRAPGYSDGLSLVDLSQLFHDMGCAVAYNLDGGQSAVMTFLGRVVNQPYKGGRDVSDIVCVVDEPDAGLAAGDAP